MLLGWFGCLLAAYVEPPKSWRHAWAAGCSSNVMKAPQTVETDRNAFLLMLSRTSTNFSAISSFVSAQWRMRLLMSHPVSFSFLKAFNVAKRLTRIVYLRSKGACFNACRKTCEQFVINCHERRVEHHAHKGACFNACLKTRERLLPDPLVSDDMPPYPALTLMPLTLMRRQAVLNMLPHVLRCRVARHPVELDSVLSCVDVIRVVDRLEPMRSVQKLIVPRSRKIEKTTSAIAETRLIAWHKSVKQ